MLAGVDLAFDDFAADPEAQIAFGARRDHAGVGALLGAGGFYLGGQNGTRQGHFGGGVGLAVAAAEDNQQGQGREKTQGKRAHDGLQGWPMDKKLWT